MKQPTVRDILTEEEIKRATKYANAVRLDLEVQYLTIVELADFVNIFELGDSINLWKDTPNYDVAIVGHILYAIKNRLLNLTPPRTFPQRLVLFEHSK